MDDDGLLLSIGELARRSGLPVRTIRFWSDAGVLPPAERQSLYALLEKLEPHSREILAHVDLQGAELPNDQRHRHQIVVDGVPRSDRKLTVL